MGKNKNGASLLRYGVIALAAALSLWGISWSLPSHSRIASVMPDGTDTPQFRGMLQNSWQDIYKKFGLDLLLNPGSFTYGFDKIATVDPGWSIPPSQLLNSARSFYLRSGHEDESDILVALSRVRPQRLELNPHIYFYGGAYMYSLGAWIAAGSLVTPATIKSGVSFYLEHPDKMAWMYLLGRLYSAAILVFGAWLIYRTGKRFFGEQSGLWAAAMFAVSPGIVIQAHYMKPHLLGAVLVLAAFNCCAELLEGGNEILWIAAGAIIGLAAGSVFYLWNSAILLLLTLWLRLRGKEINWKTELQYAGISILIAVLVFFLTNPYLIYDFHVSWEAVRRVAAFSQHDPQYLWRFPLIGFPRAVTASAALLVLLGLATPKNLQSPVRLLAFSMFIFYLANTWIFQSADKFDSIRQFPATSLGFLLAGIRIVELQKFVGARWKWSLATAALLSIGYGCLVSAVLDYNFYLDASGRSTRQAAGTWLEQNISSGSELGLLRLPQPSNAPYFQWNRYRLKFIEPQIFARMDTPSDLPAYLILTCPSYDDRPTISDVLARHYEELKNFPPFSLLGIIPPIGESFSNPLIVIYRKL